MTSSPFGQLRDDVRGRAVRFERHFDAVPDEVWASCTEPERLGRWFASVSGEFGVGGRLFIDFGNGDNTALVVTRCDPPRSFVVDWAFGDDAMSTLAVEVVADEGGALLVLDHSRLPDSAATGYGAGWHAYLDGLATDLSEGEPADWQQRFDALIGDYKSMRA
jgi:uncharacterized protein YndB with AHSA1/START domain